MKELEGDRIGMAVYDYQQRNFIERWTNRNVRDFVDGFSHIPEGHIMLPGGRVLPMAPQDDGMPSSVCITHDGFAVGCNSRLWRMNKATQEVERFCAGWTCQTTGKTPIAPEICYSTREAALLSTRTKGQNNED